MKYSAQRALLFLFCIVLLTGGSSGCLFRDSRKYQELNRILQLGNQAVASKRFDEAIHYYNSGLNIEPREVVFLTNQSVALSLRGAEKYNSVVYSKDENTRKAAQESAKQDFLEAKTLADRAVSEVNSANPLPLIDPSYKDIRINAYSALAESLRLIASTVDRSRATEALAALHEYLKVETDPDKRLKMQLLAGKMLINTSNGELAIVEYKSILKDDPNNIEALLGAGLALAQSGNKTELQEAKQYLQRFIEQAPENHPQVPVAKEILNSKM